MSEKNNRIWFHQLEERLTAAGNGNARRSVEELAAYVFGCKPLEIYFREVTPDQVAELETLTVRAERGEPIQYILGSVDFRGLEIGCDRRALIPRPEAEQLVEQVRDSGFGDTVKIADVGTGTGCIALALLAELPDAEVTAVDISSEALTLARENARRLGLGDRLQTIETSLLTGFEAESLDIVVSNPPYIFSGVWANLELCVRDYEPQLALDGGEDGLDLIRPLVEQAVRVLKPGGGLFIEIGYDQGDAVSRCLELNGFQKITITRDLAGHDRIVFGYTAPLPEKRPPLIR